MNSKIKSLLLPFYFGSIEDNERTLVERELLIDTEVLIDYLDLKRTMEDAEILPQAPSKALWFKLQEKIKPQKKMIVSFSFAAAAAVLVLGTILFLRPKSIETNNTKVISQEILFDSLSELPANSSVL